MTAHNDRDQEAPASPVKESLKAAGRSALWPARRFIDPRIQGMLTHLDARHDELLARLMSLQDLHAARADAEVEAATVVVRSLDDILRETERIALLLEQPPAKRFIRDVGELDGEAAKFLNYALGSEGFSAQHGLWFNPPVLVAHDEGSVDLRHVNERIAEIPYVFRALGALGAGAKILDVGAAESTVAFSLASLGYDVTALDPRPYPFSHPQLRAVEGRIEDWETSDEFDAVVALSTIEHIGLGAYGQDEHADADKAAMRRLYELAKPGGLLVLTAPFGASFHADDFQRTYDREHLDELLEGWEVEDLTLIRRTSPTSWETDAGGTELVGEGPVGEGPVGEGAELVALVTARRSS